MLQKAAVLYSAERIAQKQKHNPSSINYDLKTGKKMGVKHKGFTAITGIQEKPHATKVLKSSKIKINNQLCTNLPTKI